MASDEWDDREVKKMTLEEQENLIDRMNGEILKRDLIKEKDEEIAKLKIEQERIKGIIKEIRQFLPIFQDFQILIEKAMKQ